jgi:threonine dehydrogenase-like Zn-dependent dehydrogenase
MLYKNEGEERASKARCCARFADLRARGIADGAERIIAMSRHEKRQQLARESGATDIVSERGDDGVAPVMKLTNGVGADSVLECVGTQQSMNAGHPLHA